MEKVSEMALSTSMLIGLLVSTKVWTATVVRERCFGVCRRKLSYRASIQSICPVT